MGRSFGSAAGSCWIKSHRKYKFGISKIKTKMKKMKKILFASWLQIHTYYHFSTERMSENTSILHLDYTRITERTPNSQPFILEF
jgi:hypothetical protein